MSDMISCKEHEQIVRKLVFEHTLIEETEQELYHDIIKKLQKKIDALSKKLQLKKGK